MFFYLHPTITNPYHYWCGVVCFSLFHLQNLTVDTPLAAASQNGHTEIVALLLQVEEIDVNKGVSIMIPTISSFSLFFY